jgi:catechol 2,3-dioxygenase-like lactoylglutathione lyase family enzyme
MLAAIRKGDESMELVGLDHYAISVTDLERSAEGYRHVLGFHVLHKWTTTWMVGGGNVEVGLFLRPDAEPAPDTSRAIKHVAFLVDDGEFAGTQDELTCKGIEVQGPDDTGIAYSLFSADPDGHLLEITTYHSAVAPVVPSGSVVSAGSHAR